MSNSSASGEQLPSSEVLKSLTRDEVLAMIDDQFGLFTKIVVHGQSGQSETLDLESRRNEIRDLVLAKCPPVVTSENLDELKRIILPIEPRRNSNGPVQELTDEALDEKREDVVVNMMNVVHRRISTLLRQADAPEVSPKMISLQEMIGLYSARAHAITKDIQDDVAKQAVWAKGYDLNHQAIERIGQACAVEFTKMCGNFPEHASEAECELLFRDMYFAQLRHAVELKAIDEEFARLFGQNLKDQFEGTMREISKWFGTETSQEPEPDSKTMPRPQQLDAKNSRMPFDTFNSLQNDPGLSDESMSRMTELLSSVRGKNKQRLASYMGESKRNVDARIQADSGKELTLRECLTCIADVRKIFDQLYGRMRKVSASEEAIALLQTTNTAACDAWEGEVRSWFGETAERTPENLVSIPKQRVIQLLNDIARRHFPDQSMFHSSHLATDPVLAEEDKKVMGQQRVDINDLPESISLPVFSKFLEGHIASHGRFIQRLHEIDVPIAREMSAKFEQFFQSLRAEGPQLFAPFSAEALELAHVTLPTQILMHMWSEINLLSRNKPEYQAASAIFKRPGIIEKAAHLSRKNSEFRTALMEKLPAELTLQASLDFVQKNAENSARGYAELGQEFSTIGAELDGDILRILREQIYAWFASAKHSPEHSKMPCVQFHAFGEASKKILDKAGIALDSAFADLGPDVANRFYALTAKHSQELSVWEDTLRGRSFTEQECMELIATVRRKIDEHTKEYMEAGLSEATVAVCMASESEGLLEWEQKIRAWFSIRKVSVTEHKEIGPVKMQRSVYEDIVRRATDDNKVDVGTEKEMIRRAKTLPETVRLRMVSASNELQRMKGQVPNEFTEEEFRKFHARMKEADARSIAPWLTYLPKFHAKVKAEEDAIFGQVQREVSAWFQQKNKARNSEQRESKAVLISAAEFQNIAKITREQQGEIQSGEFGEKVSQALRQMSPAAQETIAESIRIRTELTQNTPQQMSLQACTELIAKCREASGRSLILWKQHAPDIYEKFKEHNDKYYDSWEQAVVTWFANQWLADEKTEGEKNSDITVPLEDIYAIIEDLAKSDIHIEESQYSSPEAVSAFRAGVAAFSVRGAELTNALPEHVDQPTFIRHQAEMLDLFTSMVLEARPMLDPRDAEPIITNFKRQHDECMQRVLTLFASKKSASPERQKEVRISFAVFNQLWGFMRAEMEAIGPQVSEAVAKLGARHALELKKLVDAGRLAADNYRAGLAGKDYNEEECSAMIDRVVELELNTQKALSIFPEFAGLAEIIRVADEKGERAWRSELKKFFERQRKRLGVDAPPVVVRIPKTLTQQMWDSVKDGEAETDQLMHLVSSLDPVQQEVLHLAGLAANEGIDKLSATYPDPMTRDEFLRYHAAALEINIGMFQSIGKTHPALYAHCKKAMEMQSQEAIRQGLAWFADQERGVDTRRTVMPRNDFVRIIDDANARFRFRARGADETAFKRLLDDFAAHGQTLVDALPSEITDWSTVEENLRRVVDYFRSTFLPGASSAGFYWKKETEDSVLQAHAAIRRDVLAQFALEGAPELVRKPKSMSKRGFETLLTEESKRGQNSNFDVPLGAVSELREQHRLYQAEFDRLIEDLPPTIFDLQTIDTLFAAMRGSLARHAFPIYDQFCTEEQAEAFKRQDLAPFIAARDTIEERYALTETAGYPATGTLSKDVLREIIKQQKDAFGRPKLTLNSADANDQIIAKAFNELDHENNRLFTELPEEIDVQTFNAFQEATLRAREMYVEPILHLLPEELASNMRHFTLNLIQQVRKIFLITLHEAQETMKPTLLPRNEFSAIGQSVWENSPVEFKIPDSKSDQATKIIKQYEDLQGELFNKLPPVIADWETIRRFHVDTEDLYEEQFAAPLLGLVDASSIENSRRRRKRGIADLEGEIEKRFDLPKGTESAPSRPSLSRDKLRMIFEQEWQSAGRLLARRYFPDDKDLQQKMSEPLPETIQEVFDSVCPSLIYGPDELEDMRVQLLEPVERERLAKSGSDGAVVSFREPAWQGFMERVCHLFEKNVVPDLSNIPEVITREWVEQELLAAAYRSHYMTQGQDAAESDRQALLFSESLQPALRDFCPPVVTTIADLEHVLYTLIGRNVVLQDSLMPEGAKPLDPRRKSSDQWCFELALKRIQAGVLGCKDPDELPKESLLSGIPAHDAAADSTQQSFTADHVERVYGAALHNAIADFLRNRRKKSTANISRLQDSLEAFEDTARKLLHTFITEHCPPVFTSAAPFTGIHSFLGYCIDTCETWLEAVGEKKLFSLLEERMRTALNTVHFNEKLRERKKTTTGAKAENSNSTDEPKTVLSGPPALLREPWSPKAQEPERKSSEPELFWKEIFSRALSKQARALVEHCTSEGIVFPSERRAQEARVILRTMFQKLQETCSGAISRICEGKQYGPHADDLAEEIGAAVTELTILPNLPMPLQDAFSRVVQDPLLTGFVGDMRPLVLEYSSAPSASLSSWEQELEVLFSSREALPPSDALELQEAIEPVKHAFATTMLQSMASAAQRRPAGMSEDHVQIYAVSVRDFSASWIPVIQGAVSTIVDAYVSQQPARGPTIRDFLRQHFSSVRQRTLFTRACSAVETRLKALRDQAPADALLTAMRRPIDPLDIDVLLDGGSPDIAEVISGELLGPRDATLLPGERSLLHQFCRNTFDFEKDLPDQLARCTDALAQLAQECIRSFHAGFPSRTAEHLQKYLSQIADTERREYLLQKAKAAEERKEKLDEKLPPHVAELSRMNDENELWILTWPKGRKRNDQLGGFLQQVLHWQETAAVFIAQWKKFGEAMGSFEEAKLCSDSVTRVRLQNILVVVEPKTLQSGRKRKAGLKMHEKKFQSFFDWRQERERSLRTGAASESSENSLHPDARSLLEAVWKQGREMQALEMQLLEETGDGPSAAELVQRLAGLQEARASAAKNLQDVNEMLLVFQEWSDEAPDKAELLLSNITYSLSNIDAVRMAAHAAMPAARIAVDTAQKNLTERTSGKRIDPREMDALCNTLAAAQENLLALEQSVGEQMEARRHQLFRWETVINESFPRQAGSSPETSTAVDFDLLQKEVGAFVVQLEEWKLINAEKQQLEEEIDLLDAEIAQTTVMQGTKAVEKTELSALELQVEALRTGLREAMERLTRLRSSKTPRP